MKSQKLTGLLGFNSINIHKIYLIVFRSMYILCSQKKIASFSLKFPLALLFSRKKLQLVYANPLDLPHK